MWTLVSMVVLVLGILLVERIGMVTLTRHPRGREWVRGCRLLHPNTISIVRLPMGVVAILFAHMGWWALATVWFSFWMISDLSDGTIARNCDLVTETGKWLDPFSDKAMYFPGLLYCAFASTVRIPLPWQWVILFIALDTFGQSSRLFIRNKAANYFGKVKTAFVTILLAVTALDQIHALAFVTPRLVYLVTVSCALLAFMSAYCKIIPDSWYANNLTFANFCCGLAAIWSIHADHPLRAFVLVFIGQFFDLFDGRLARIFGSTRHGPVFDDLADGTSFGAAIAYLIVDGLSPGLPAFIAGLAAVTYLGCVVFRLYRFLHPTVTLPPGIFQGMPSPAAALLAGSAVLLFGDSRPWIAVLVVAAASVLMISNVRYRHFARNIWPAFPRPMKLIVGILLFIYVDAAFTHRLYTISFSTFCFSLGILYTFFGIHFQTYFHLGKPTDPGAAGASEAQTPSTDAS